MSVVPRQGTGLHCNEYLFSIRKTPSHGKVFATRQKILKPCFLRVILLKPCFNVHTTNLFESHWSGTSVTDLSTASGNGVGEWQYGDNYVGALQKSTPILLKI